MKKIIGGIVAVLAVAIIGLSIYRTVLSYLPENENDYSEEVSYLNDEVDFKMYLYGEDIVAQLSRQKSEIFIMN